jgi:hypothetical protein
MPSKDRLSIQRIGQQLGDYVARQNTSRTEAVALRNIIADLAGNEARLLTPLQDLVSRKDFQTLKPHALTGTGQILRDSIANDLSNVYLPKVVKEIEAFLNGFLNTTGGVSTPSTGSIGTLASEPELGEPGFQEEITDDWRERWYRRRKR